MARDAARPASSTSTSTDWLPKVVDVKTIHPAALKYLCEYPTGSGHYFGAPARDRRRGFRLPQGLVRGSRPSRLRSRSEYKNELAVPDTWDELKDSRRVLHRPDQKRYGNALLTGRGYDALVMGFEQLLWEFGGSWGDAKTLKVKGALDSANAVRALDFFKGLLAIAPPDGTNLDYGEALEPFVSGSTAMVMNYFAFFPDLVKKMSGKVGFFVMPKQGDQRFSSLGGQGMSISTKVSAAQQTLAKTFIAWFLKTDTQEKWMQKPGGFTANAEILKSEAFKKATPYNEPVRESMDIAQDFWNVPAYNELIATTAQQLGEALDGKKSPQEALTQIAAEHETTLHEAAP